MAVNTGYKQSEAGEIPKDWKVVCAEKLATITTGSKNTQDRVEDGEFPFFVRSQTVERIDTYSFDGEAVLTAGDGVGTGKVFHYIDGKFDAHQRVYRISDFDGIDGYFFYLYFSNHFYNRIMQMTAKSSVDSVRREMIARMAIPLPPTLAEQEAIAEALSDADALIESLEQLLAKKRQIKQGAMQELLTGKKRLPGFEKKKGYKQTEVGPIPEDWNLSPLAKLCHTISDGTHFTPHYVDTGIPFYSVENVTANNFSETKFISEAEHEILLKRCKPEKGDILMTRIGSLGDTKLLDWDVNASIYVSLALLKPGEFVASSYLYSYTESQDFVREVEKRSLLNATPKKINMGDISAIPVLHPPTLAEQESIATMLSDMNEDIAAMESKRDKARQIKRGMMQELLTGRIRLV